MNSFGTDEQTEENEDSSLVKTCHLCGKAQCGQRKGRVRCAYCKRIFCLQQLNKKFKIKANVEDKNFKCPRCTGICCCVCNCQRPPPHVHCKVYKVRQNKRRVQEFPNQPTPTNQVNPAPHTEIPNAMVVPSMIRNESPFPQVVPYPMSISPVIHHENDSESADITETGSTFGCYDIPGSKSSYSIIMH